MLVDPLEVLTIAIKLKPDTGAFGDGDGGQTAPFGPILVVDGAGVAVGFGIKQGAGVAPPFVFDFGGVTVVGRFEGPGEMEKPASQMGKPSGSKVRW